MTDVQTELRQLQRGIASSSKNVEGFGGRVVSEASGTVLIREVFFLMAADLLQSTSLSDTIEKHCNNTAERLASIHQTSRSLLDQGTREDVPTGMTPRKRVWEYVDQWELTKSRDALLQSRRRGESTRHVSEPPLPQHPHSPAESFSELEVEISPLSNADEYYPDEPQTPVPPSPPVISLSSLASSTATLTDVPVAPPVVPQILKKPITLKSGLPTMGALVDRPPNTLRPRMTRRIR